MAEKRSLPQQRKPATFTRDVAPLLQAHCTGCHHEGGVAPFSLLTFEDARKHAKTIATVTETLSPASATFERWQVAQLARLLAALRRATGR